MSSTARRVGPIPVSLSESDLRPDLDPLPDAGTVVTSGPLTPLADSVGTAQDAQALRHSVAEDIQHMLLATLVASLALAVFAQVG